MFKIYDGREHFYQWDTNRKLIVDDVTIKEVHFCNRTEECSLICETYVEDGITLVNVPNILLTTDWKIRVYAYDGQCTKYDKCFEVVGRTKPSDYIYTETEVKNYEQFVETLAELENQINNFEITEGINSNTKVMCYPDICFEVDAPNSIYLPEPVDASGITKGMYVNAFFDNVRYRGIIASASSNYIYLDTSNSDSNDLIAHAGSNIFDLIIDGGKYGTKEFDGIEFTSNAEGDSNTAYINAHAEGIENEAKGYSSHAEGGYNIANGEYSHVEGYENIAFGHVSHVEGIKNIASGSHAHTEGYMNEASGSNSHVEGSANKSIGVMSHAEGYMNEASGEMAHVEGYKNFAIGNYSHAEGNENYVTGKRAHVEGYNNRASGENAHSEGEGNFASGYNSHAEGISNRVSASAGHAEGNGNTVTGEIAHAEGGGNTASAKAAHVEGYLNTASGAQSHAEGRNTIAHGEYSHAEGLETQANGGNAHAEGYKAIANSSNSHVEGDRTVASSPNQHVQGKFNVEDANSVYAHIVGGGTSDTDRKNIHTVDWNGNGFFSGNVESNALILKAPNGKRYKIAVDNNGTLTTTAI